MNKVFNRVAGWNAKRYPQEYNHALSVALLREEYTEWLVAKTDVEKLDGLCDQIYVAMGVLWKCNAPLAELEESTAQSQRTMEHLIAANELWPGYFVGTYLDVYEHDLEYPVVQAMCNIIQANMCQMMSMGLNFSQCIEALNIVCDANDSKSIKKTAADKKANDGDKGPYFVSPEPRLQSLLDKRKEF